MIILLFSGCSKARRMFDFYIDLTTEGDIRELSGKTFVEGVFPFTLMIFRLPGYDNPMTGQLALLAAPSFDNLDVSPYAELIKEDRAIMQDPGRHPILISSDLAKACGLSAGDTFYQETNLSEEKLSFTVAGVFRQDTLFAQYEAVALINDQIVRIFENKVDELGYTNAYVKALDQAALKAFLDEDFIPHLQFKGMTEEEIAALPKEDKKCYYEEYAAHMKRMR